MVWSKSVVSRPSRKGTLTNRRSPLGHRARLSAPLWSTQHFRRCMIACPFHTGLLSRLQLLHTYLIAHIGRSYCRSSIDRPIAGLRKPICEHRFDPMQSAGCAGTQRNGWTDGVRQEVGGQGRCERTHVKVSTAWFGAVPSTLGWSCAPDGSFGRG